MTVARAVAPTATQFRVDYGPDMENALADLQLLLHGSALQAALPLRWTALKLLEGDRSLWRKCAHSPAAPAL
jgi:Fe2+ transport system protein B